mmetsp:Transcript_31994/g.77350  ORF Transcript_31994/g.77350 Transcript_31994/m.77350 type:complete len:83 (+) Transcript_31994:3588-3836(+)
MSVSVTVTGHSTGNYSLKQLLVLFFLIFSPRLIAIKVCTRTAWTTAGVGNNNCEAGGDSGGDGNCIDGGGWENHKRGRWHKN